MIPLLLPIRYNYIVRKKPPMRCKVQLYVAGKVFNEMVEARDYQEARQVALARNPNAKIIGVTAVFG